MPEIETSIIRVQCHPSAILRVVPCPLSGVGPTTSALGWMSVVFHRLPLRTCARPCPILVFFPCHLGGNHIKGCWARYCPPIFCPRHTFYLLKMTLNTLVTLATFGVLASSVQAQQALYAQCMPTILIYGAVLY